MTKQDSLKYPPEAIAGPEKQKFEIRIVCWKSSGVKVPGVKFIDMFCQFNMDGDTHTVVTDTHWRNKNGNASWNWRVKIPIELPLDAREKARLRVRMFNRSIIASNVEIGANSVDLYDWLLIAYRNQERLVTPWEEVRDALKKRGLGGSALVDEEEADGDGDDDDANNPEVIDADAFDDEDENNDQKGGDDAGEHDDDDDDGKSLKSAGGDDDDNRPLLNNGNNKNSSSASGIGGSIKMNKLDSKSKNPNGSKVNFNLTYCFAFVLLNCAFTPNAACLDLLVTEVGKVIESRRKRSKHFHCRRR